MDMDWSSLHKTISDNTRRSILELLAERDALNYTEIMTVLSITNTGRLNYHLKALGDLITKDSEGRYRLTEKGKLAANMLKTFPERTRNGSSHLRKVVSLVLVFIGTFVVVPIVAFGLFFFAVDASTSFIFALFLSSSLAIGLALIVVGILIYKNRLLHSI